MTTATDTFPDDDPPIVAFPVRPTTSARTFEERRARPYAGWWRALAFALPFAAVGLVLPDGVPSEAHRALIADATSGGDGLSFHPVPALLAWLWRAEGWLVAVGVLAAGLTLRMLARGLVERSLARPVVWLFLAAMIASPGMHRLVASDVALPLLVLVTVVVLGGVVAFTAERVTADGFFAGISLGIGVLIHPAALWLVAVAATWVFSLTWLRHRGARDAISAAWAAVTVIAFPAFVALVGVWCVGWASGNEPQTWPWHGMTVPTAESARSALDDLGSAVLVTPLYVVGLAIALGGAVRRPVVASVYVLPLALLFLCGAFGLELSGAFAEVVLAGTVLLLVRPVAFVGQLDLALVAVLQIAVGLARASGQV